jgi:hypothetical protein
MRDLNRLCINGNFMEEMVLTLGMKGIFHQSIMTLKIIENVQNDEAVPIIIPDDGRRTTEKEGTVIQKSLIPEKVSILDLAA